MPLKKIVLIDLICIPVLAIIIGIASLIFTSNFNTSWTHFADQAQSFLVGKLDLTPLGFDKHDYVIRDEKYYWPEGPFPSVALIPIQILTGPTSSQGKTQLVLIVILSFSLFKLARIKQFSPLDSFFLTSVFLLGSPVIGLIVDPKSWFFAQIVSCTFLTLLILELETKRRWLLLGILEATLLATRPTSGFIILALLFFLYKENVPVSKKLYNLLYFLLPVFISIFVLMWFNYARFGNPLDNGYISNDVGGFIGPLRDLGLFSLQHIPTNLYYYFLTSVDPVFSNISIHLKFPFIKYDGVGLSLLLVAPFFLYSLNSLKKGTIYLNSFWAVIGLTLFTQLSYYAPGWVQFGPRYTTDFMPILFLITLHSLTSSRLTTFQKIAIFLSSSFNVYLLSTTTFPIR